jgi:hypothetical protein
VRPLTTTGSQKAAVAAHETSSVRAPLPLGQRNGAQPDAASAAEKAKSSLRKATPTEPDKATSDRTTDRKFDPNAAVGAEED